MTSCQALEHRVTAKDRRRSSDDASSVDDCSELAAAVEPEANCSVASDANAGVDDDADGGDDAGVDDDADGGDGADTGCH